MDRTEDGGGVRRAITAVLCCFQEGYRSRDVGRAGSFVRKLFSPDPQITVVGTGAVRRGGFEWCQGPEQCRQIIAEDWRSWGDLIIDVPGAHISHRGAVAWVATVGIVLRPAGDGTGEGRSPTRRSELPRQLERLLPAGAAEAHPAVWPLRWSAVLVQEDGRWLFHQMHFSYPGLVDPR